MGKPAHGLDGKTTRNLCSPDTKEKSDASQTSPFRLRHRGTGAFTCHGGQRRLAQHQRGQGASTSAAPVRLRSRPIRRKLGNEDSQGDGGLHPGPRRATGLRRRALADPPSPRLHHKCRQPLPEECATAGSASTESSPPTPRRPGSRNPADAQAVRLRPRPGRWEMGGENGQSDSGIHPGARRKRA